MTLDNYDIAGIITMSILALMFFRFCLSKIKGTKKDSTIKACIDCKHCRKTWLGWLAYPYWRCAVQKSSTTQNVNLILGTIETKTELRYCDLERKYTVDSCGKEGNWFEKK